MTRATTTPIVSRTLAKRAPLSLALLLGTTATMISASSSSAVPSSSSSSSSSSSVVVAQLVPRKHDPSSSKCPTVLSMARSFDLDDSGGLDRSEFDDFINGLDGNADAADVDVDSSSSSSLDENADLAYDQLLCQCHLSFGHDRVCCDDTATDDEFLAGDDDDGGSLGEESAGGESPIWREVSLDALGVADEDDDEDDIDAGEVSEENQQREHYRKVFCDWVLWVASEGGLVLSNITDVGIEDAMITTTTMATTEAVEEEVGNDVDAAEAASTTTIATTTTTTSTSTSATLTTSTSQMPVEPFTLSFLGGTDGVYGADDVDYDDVTHAFWELNLDILGGIMNRIFGGSRRYRAARLMVIDRDRNDDGKEAVVGNVKVSFPDRTLVVHEEGGMANVDVKRVNEPDGGVVSGRDDDDKRKKYYGGMKRRKLQWDFGEEAAVFFESVIMDVEDVDCPAGLPYAIERSPCLNFINTLIPLPGGPLDSPELVELFIEGFRNAVNVDGQLYDFLVEEYPETIIVGLGEPGKGRPLPSSSSSSANQEMQVSSITSAESARGGGLTVGGIVGAVLCSIVAALAIAAFVVNRRRGRRRMLDDSNPSEDIEANEVNADAANVETWLDDEDESRRAVDAATSSSLAAMGVASLVTTQLSSPDKDVVANNERQAPQRSIIDGSAVATRLSTGDTEVMMVEQQTWARETPDI